MTAPDETAEIIRELREKLDKAEEMEALTDAAYREIVKANSRNSARVVLLERERDTLVTRAETAEKRLAEYERLSGAKLVPKSDWRPIETAPKDGTRILLGRFTGNPKGVREGYIAVDWYRQHGDAAGFIGFGKFNATHWPPTHWMPLPAPPATIPCAQVAGGDF